MKGKQKQKKESRTDRIVKIETKGLHDMYKDWEKVQSIITRVEEDLNEVLRRTDPVPREFLELDWAAGKMEDAFTAFEAGIKKRGES